MRKRTPLVDCEHVAAHESVAFTPVEHDNIELTNLRNAARYGDDLSIHSTGGCAWKEGRLNRTFLGGQHAIADLHFFAGVAHEERGNLALLGNDLPKSDIRRLLTEHLVRDGVPVQRASTHETVGLTVLELPPHVEPIAAAYNQALGLALNHIRSSIEHALSDDSVFDQEALNVIEIDRRNRVFEWRRADLWPKFFVGRW